MGMNPLAQNMRSAGLDGIDRLAGNAMFPQSQMDKTQYAVSSQMPTSAEVVRSDYDPKTDPYSGLPMQPFKKGGLAAVKYEKGGDVETRFENTPIYINPEYGYAHDPVLNAMNQSRNTGAISKYMGNKADLTPEEEEALRVRAMVLSANPKYDPRYMPLRADDRPMTDIQAALLRLQAEKQLGEGTARAGIAGLVGALPGKHGITAIPGAYDIGYRTPVGPGNLDVSAFRAMKAMQNGQTPQGVRASYSIPFAQGGIIPRFNGSEESQVQGFDPESGKVKLQKLSDPNDPFSEVTTVDYTVPKDQIKSFEPDIDPETNTGLGSGRYILNDGSTMFVSADGIVQSATPGRNDYTLNKDDYYQPTGENLTWRGDQNMLYKKIGGVDVNVPNIYHKGGYKNPDGSLRVDANGVPIALAPNYLDSGFGKSGLADAAPYVTAALMLAATGMPVGFEGMVPASETLMGGLGALGSGSGAVPLSEITGSTFTGPQFAIDPTAAYTAAGAGAAEGVAGGAGGASGAGEAVAKGSTMKDAFNAYRYANLAKNVLGMAAGASGRTGVPGYGLNNNPAYSAFNPGTTGVGLPGLATYEKTPWANMAPPITLSKLSDFAPDRELASGGIAHLGGYSDGGRLLKGPGDGMSDNIPASISGKQPARLADGEFVVPADVVSHLGNGSTDAGAKQLYAMMDKVRKARTGNPKQGKQINPDKFLPKG